MIILTGLQLMWWHDHTGWWIQAQHITLLCLDCLDWTLLPGPQPSERPWKSCQDQANRHWHCCPAAPWGWTQHQINNPQCHAHPLSPGMLLLCKCSCLQRQQVLPYTGIWACTPPSPPPHSTLIPLPFIIWQPCIPYKYSYLHSLSSVHLTLKYTPPPPCLFFPCMCWTPKLQHLNEKEFQLSIYNQLIVRCWLPGGYMFLVWYI